MPQNKSRKKGHFPIYNKNLSPNRKGGISRVLPPSVMWKTNKTNKCSTVPVIRQLRNYLKLTEELAQSKANSLDAVQVHLLRCVCAQTHQSPVGSDPSGTGQLVAQPGVRGSPPCAKAVLAPRLSWSALRTLHAADSPGLRPTSTTGWAWWPRIHSPPNPNTEEKWTITRRVYTIIKKLLGFFEPKSTRRLRKDETWLNPMVKFGMQVKETAGSGFIKPNAQSIQLDRHVVIARYLKGQACPWHSSADWLLLLLSEQTGPFAPTPFVWTQFLPLPPENTTKYDAGYCKNQKKRELSF